MSTCKETSGILFQRPCKNPAEFRCSLTGMPICRAHMREWEGQPASLSAVREALKERRSRGEGGSEGYQDDPYFFHYYTGSYDDSYDASDYELFDGVAEGADFGAFDGDGGAWEGS